MCSIGFAACSAVVADACLTVVRFTRAVGAARRALARASFAFFDARRSMTRARFAVARARFGLLRVNRTVACVSFALVRARCALERVNRTLGRASRTKLSVFLSANQRFARFAFQLGKNCLSRQASRAVSTFYNTQNLPLHSSHERPRNPPL